MKLKKAHWIGIIAGFLTLIIASVLFLNVFNLDIFTKNTKMFYFIVGIACVIGSLPFVFSTIAESEKEKEKNEMFLEFSRDLVEGVRTGTPISKCIINVRDKNYGKLTPNTKKLANQISLGIPVKDALTIFERDVSSSMVTRAITLIKEADKAGGEIEEVLDSVVASTAEIEELKKQRKSATYNLIVQGYMIFFVFIVIMLVMEFKVIPMTTGITAEMGDATGTEGMGVPGLGGFGASTVSKEELTAPLLYLLLAQGFMAGLTIGKLAEGRVKAGIKHSFVMVVIALLASTGARAFLG